ASMGAYSFRILNGADARPTPEAHALPRNSRKSVVSAAFPIVARQRARPCVRLQLSAGQVFSMILAPLRRVILAPGQRLTAASKVAPARVRVRPDVRWESGNLAICSKNPAAGTPTARFASVLTWPSDLRA